MMFSPDLSIHGVQCVKVGEVKALRNGTVDEFTVRKLTVYVDGGHSFNLYLYSGEEKGLRVYDEEAYRIRLCGVVCVDESTNAGD